MTAACAALVASQPDLADDALHIKPAHAFGLGLQALRRILGLRESFDDAPRQHHELHRRFPSELPPAPTSRRTKRSPAA
jgi:hypothetical protein